SMLSINANGDFTYDPNGAFDSLPAGQTATDTFTYTIDDGRGQANSTDSATVTITITGGTDNRPPNVTNGSLTAVEGSTDNPVGLSAPSDPDDDPLTISVSGLPALGTVRLSGGEQLSIGQTLSGQQLSSLLYDAPSSWNGSDDPGVFRFDVSDGVNAPVAGTVLVNLVQSGSAIVVSNASELSDALASATGGELILLEDGNYGPLTIEDRSFSSKITIRAQNEREAVFDRISLRNSNNIRVEGVVSTAPSGSHTDTSNRIVHIDGSQNIDFVNSEVYSIPGFDRNNPSYTQMGVNFGVQVESSVDILLDNNFVHDVRRGFWGNGNNLTFRGNVVDWVRDDGFKNSGINGGLFENNTGPRYFNKGPGDHADFIQFQGTAANSDLVFRGNVVIPYVAATYQGIFLDDAVSFTNVLFEDNIIVNALGRGISVSNGTNITARYNTLITIPDYGHKASFISGATVSEHNITSHVDSQPGQTGTNYLMSWDEPSSSKHYDEFYASIGNGLGLTIQDLIPVAGSPAESAGAFKRINQLL
ncbi:MAG: Ig-like domain-containing protein, partial [Planctomycetota bacterium]